MKLLQTFSIVINFNCSKSQQAETSLKLFAILKSYARTNRHTVNSLRELHGWSMFAVKAKIYGVLYKQSSSIAFDETSSYWPVIDCIEKYGKIIPKLSLLQFLILYYSVSEFNDLNRYSGPVLYY